MCVYLPTKIFILPLTTVKPNRTLFRIKKMFNFIANKGSFKNFNNGSYPEKFTWKLSENNQILHWLNAQYI